MKLGHTDPADGGIPVYGFMHIATHGRWREIVAELFDSLRSSGLLRRTTRLFVGIVGPDCDSFAAPDSKVQVVWRSPDVEAFEFPTLQALHAHCRVHRCFVYYVHTKGVFRDTPETTCWRQYMSHFIADRHEDCITALRSADVCGVNWCPSPWPHFSGNFWWARSDYVAKLPPLETLPKSIDGWDQEYRHHCERWVGSGPGVKALSLHQAHVDQYEVAYTRDYYAGPSPGAARVALVFDSLVRRDTTGVYCLRALRRMVQVAHYFPCEMAAIPAHAFDFFLYVDDGMDYELPACLRPSVMWAIDTHINPARLVRRAAGVDLVFAAQRDGVGVLRSNGVNCVGWLPLACDPEIHRKHPIAKELDACFVAHLSTAPRLELAGLLRLRFPRSFVGQKFFDEMARTYSASRVVLNLSVGDDVNMRVFEAMSCGSLLLTNDLADKGQDRLFTDGEHLVAYRDFDELTAKLEHYLADEDERERIAEAGRLEANARHTYAHRMAVILDAVRERLDGAAPAARALRDDPPGAALHPSHPAVYGSMTSIVIVTLNGLQHTVRCLESIERWTPERHEVVVVDNGSTDGTRQYLRGRRGVRLIENEANAGFPAAANQGIRAGRGGNILLLNNDVIVTRGWLGRLTAALWSDARMGLVGPCSNEVSGPQRVPVDYLSTDGVDRFAETFASRFPGQLQEVDRLVGFCLMLRREVVDCVGLLDERFGIGNFEDDDYCTRARLAGFHAAIVLDCFVHHFGSATFKASGADYAGLMRHNEQLFREKWAAAAPPAPLGLRDLPGSPAAHDAPAPAEAREPHEPVTEAATEPSRLSVCVIARDSSRTLGACLESIRPWVDEMVVVDTGSADDTPAIAEAAGARVYHFPWCDDFSAARNESLKHAGGDWLFWMDSDDTVDAANGRKLRDLVDRRHPPTTLGFVLQVRCPTGGAADPYATDTLVDHVKVFRNHPGIWFTGRIHEQVLPAIRRLGGEVEWTDIVVSHSGSDITPEGRARKQARDLRLLELEMAEGPDGTFTLFNIGMTLLDAGRAADALGPLCRSLQLCSPGDSHVRKVYALLVQCYADLGRAQTALATCTQGLAVYPQDPELVFRRGVLQQSLGQLEAAEESFRTIVETTADRHFSSVDRGIFGIKAWHNLSLVYEARGRFDLAVQGWGRVLEYDRSNPVAWRGLLDALAAAGDGDGLERACREGEHPSAPRDVAVLARARLAALRGDALGAVADLESKWREANSVDLLAEMCELAFRNDLLDVAERGLSELARHRPADASAFQNLGMVHMRRRDFAGAAECARRSLDLRPGYPPAERLLGDAVALGQDPAEAAGVGA